MLTVSHNQSNVFKILKKLNKLINKYLIKKLTIILTLGTDIIYFKYE